MPMRLHWNAQSFTFGFMLPNASRKALEDFIDKKDDLIFMVDGRFRTSDYQITSMTP